MVLQLWGLVAQTAHGTDQAQRTAPTAARDHASQQRTRLRVPRTTNRVARSPTSCGPMGLASRFVGP